MPINNVNKKKNSKKKWKKRVKRFERRQVKKRVGGERGEFHAAGKCSAPFIDYL